MAEELTVISSLEDKVFEKPIQVIRGNYHNQGWKQLGL